MEIEFFIRSDKLINDEIIMNLSEHLNGTLIGNVAYNSKKLLPPSAYVSIKKRLDNENLGIEIERVERIFEKMGIEMYDYAVTSEITLEEQNKSLNEKSILTFLLDEGQSHDFLNNRELVELMRENNSILSYIMKKREPWEEYFFEIKIVILNKKITNEEIERIKNIMIENGFPSSVEINLILHQKTDEIKSLH